VPDVRLETIVAVCNYAVSFRWSDVHSTGIYNFDYLRTLCPCSECENN